MSTAAIVSLGRRQAMGEVRRVASWRQMFEAAGADVVDVVVAPDRRPHLDGLAPVVSGRAAPERLAWSGPRLDEGLAWANPSVVVVVSTRALDPRVFDGPWTVVLDQVDSLARSYRDRADVVDGTLRRLGYRVLATTHARVERLLHDTPTRRVAAGWVDAGMLGAEWVPNLVDDSLTEATRVEPDRDVVFFGTLRYPPNVDALERMARFWPLLEEARPGTSALVAGAAPTARVRELCAVQGWELVADFASLPHLARRARVAVAPLRRVAGIQNKVLDAASVGLAQVVTPAAVEGFRPGLPLVAQATDTELVDEIVRLIDDPAARQAQVTALREHLRGGYSSTAWTPWAKGVLDHCA